MRILDRVDDLANRGARAARAVRDVGVMRPIRPDRAVRLLFAYARFGPVPATIGAMSALRFPGRTALIDERGALSYRELERRAASLATALHHRLDGDRVGILCRNHRGFVETVLAASRLGNDVVLLNTDFSATQLGQVIEREHIGVLVHDEEFGSTVAESGFAGRQLLAWTDDDAHESIDALMADTEPEPLNPANTSRVIVMTSGTTGTPKGARHDISLSALLPVALSHLMRVPVRSGAPIVIAPPLFHILGFAYTAVGLALGMPLVLSRRFDAHAMLQAVADNEAEALVAVPVMLQRILDLEERPGTPSLRTVVCGGSALHPHLSDAFMDEFGDVLVNVYGATETGWATIATPDDLRKAPGTAGKPTFRLTIKILNENGEEVPIGHTGEIYTGGGLRFAGYTTGGGKRLRDGLTGTGDLGHLDEAGRLFIDGRTDDMIVSGGENVFPGEVEALLDGHPEIAEVSVTGVDDERFGQRLAAHIVRKPTSQITEDEVRTYVKEHLARYKAPRDVTFVDELPRTSTGKVKASTLR
ncbi:fatty-acyl-CoA synthase [Actinomadura pelletieri DSM 43383]|uniref:Fatty-acyl-CoA synthase n=1 Tax=Actinomadura pelletieri DSM 43383 TaxID=1120940 RepID=A0A495QI60_9ACTN|nr:AMP-binding protein [Actinomadura pelletieri]RKS71811.1 fatty-acyl-CoA synthase [Actinomadura pelletieri DSM 43383]